MLHIYTIAINTYRESVRSKVLYALFFFAAVLLAISAFFGTVTIGDQIKVIKNFGLFSLTLFSVLYAVIAGAALLHKELTRKTIYNILAKAVERRDFMLGKYFGMLGTVTLMIILMGCALVLFCWPFNAELDLSIGLAVLGIFFQLVIICAVALFFSSIVVTPMLSGAFTFGVFLAGRSTDYLLYFINNGTLSGFSAQILKVTYFLLPHLNWLDQSNAVVHGQTVEAEKILWSLIYSVCYAGVLLVLANFFFKRKEFNQ